jgi:hypothetical protein
MRGSQCNARISADELTEFSLDRQHELMKGGVINGHHLPCPLTQMIYESD